MHENIQLLNYSQDAIKDLRNYERGLLYGCPISSYVIRTTIELISDSTKFILPNCADFIDPEGFTQTHLDLARLPYPVVVFEIPWKKSEPMRELKDFPSQLSTKRIALCIDFTVQTKHLCPVPNIDALLERYPEGGVMVFSIYFVDNDQSWLMCHGGSFIPYNNKVEGLKNSSITHLPATAIAAEQLFDAGMLSKKNQKQFRVEPFVALPELSAHMAHEMGSKDKMIADILLNTRDEVIAYIGACSLLNCANVVIESAHEQQAAAVKKLPPSARKKQKPQPKPKFEYKVLQISEERLNHKSDDNGQQSGQSTPRRTHLRRGHIRRLKERLIWVRPSVINPAGTAGVIAKDYKMTTKRTG